jgi:16S rRNA (adenine1518-N6/adenine1519-N6)-dimethyltransferase
LPLLINYDSPAKLRAFLDERGLGMRKKLGQNFLVNAAARSRLLDSLEPEPGDKVWEIGPGLGAMTAGLLERGAVVTAFEIDSAFVRVLKELFASHVSDNAPALKIIEGDALKTWPAEAGLYKNDDELFLLGNLPYNIAAALLGDFIEKGRFFKRMVVTVQREVGLRMCAGPGSRDYSSFSVLCSSVYKVSPLFVLKGSLFYPSPRVDSQGLRLDLLPRHNYPKLFYPLVRSLFSSRRKTIRNTLSGFASSVILGEEALRRAGISGGRRAETLGIDEFVALALSLEDLVSNGT